MYQFRVVAKTSYGESTSPWSTVQTPQDREYIIAIPVPKLTSLSVTSLHLSQSFVMYIITIDYYDHVKSYKKISKKSKTNLNYCTTAPYTNVTLSVSA